MMGKLRPEPSAPTSFSRSAAEPLLSRSSPASAVAHEPNAACKLLFGSGTPQAPIDAGFQSTPFEHGLVDVRPGSDELDFNALQDPMSTSARLASLG